MYSTSCATDAVSAQALLSGPCACAAQRCFALHEFSGAELLRCSDSKPLWLAELLALADANAWRLFDGARLGCNDSAGMRPLRG